jgi:hypothetical protein
MCCSSFQAVFNIKIGKINDSQLPLHMQTRKKGVGYERSKRKTSPFPPLRQIKFLFFFKQVLKQLDNEESFETTEPHQHKRFGL